MEQSDKTAIHQGQAGSVRVGSFPKYCEVRRLLAVWPEWSKNQITTFQRAITAHTGTPSNPVDWKDPDTWIPELLAGDDGRLADAIWNQSDKTVNPRYTAGSWSLVRTYALLAEDPHGNMQLTDRGRDFAAQPLGAAEALIDEQEGLIELLRIVREKGPARSGVLVDPWAKFLSECKSRNRSKLTIQDTLRRRMSNLLDRALLRNEGRAYSITEGGMDYLHRVGKAVEIVLPQEAALPVVIAGNRSNSGFANLTESLEHSGLIFSQEIVANYVLALQTKRFAILTGISGTGKTRIAKAVAEHFRRTVARKVSTSIPDDATVIEARRSQIKDAILTVPKMMAARLSLVSDAPISDRRLPIRYPDGDTELTYYLKEQSTYLYLSGEFKQWFRANVNLGDQIWLRVLDGDAPKPDRLEFGLPGTQIRVRPLDNYVVVPVRPDWVDNRGLLGYLNPLTDEYVTTPFLNLLLRAREEEGRAAEAGEKPHPFFVILDEMNLARVEHYFSDFLSAVESGEAISLHESEAIESGDSESGPQVPRRLTIPGNVLFTGTVNVDETTYMFSPKVLDRAFTIEFDQVDLRGFSKSGNGSTLGLSLDGARGRLDLLRSSSSEPDDWKPNRQDWIAFSKQSGRHYSALLQLHGLLAGHHRHFGYRVANEIGRFVNLAMEQAKDADAAADAAFDLALLQKVLPKFHGTQQELEPLLESILQFAVHGGVRPSKNDHAVDLGDWIVVEGRLAPRSKSPPPSGTPGTDGNGADLGRSQGANAGTDPRSPSYPRTGAKVLRMLRRLRDRGFTSFIE